MISSIPECLFNSVHTKNRVESNARNMSGLSSINNAQFPDAWVSNMPPTTTATNLDLLPPELLLLISQHLSPVDSTCLTLCSHRLFTLPFRDLMYSPCPQGGSGSSAADGDLRIDLLTRLSRGLPEYYLCYACLRLHLWRHVSLPAPNLKLRKCYDNLPWDKQKSLSLSLIDSLEFPVYSTCGFHWYTSTLQCGDSTWVLRLVFHWSRYYIPRWRHSAFTQVSILRSRCRKSNRGCILAEGPAFDQSRHEFAQRPRASVYAYRTLR